jgi:hypothetical protein
VFYAIIPLVPPIVAVQVDPEQLEGKQGSELLAKVGAYFMRPVVLAAWDQDSRFVSRGAVCDEGLLIDEDLQWRQFELPPEPEIPF